MQKNKLLSFLLVFYRTLPLSCVLSLLHKRHIIPFFSLGFFLRNPCKLLKYLRISPPPPPPPALRHQWHNSSTKGILNVGHKPPFKRKGSISFAIILFGLILLTHPTFLFGDPTSPEALPVCDLSNFHTLSQSTGCALNNSTFANSQQPRIYSPRAARECTKDRRSDNDGRTMYIPTTGTGYCEVDLGAIKDPRAFFTFFNEIFPDTNITSWEELNPAIKTFNSRVSGGQVGEKEWEKIDTKLQEMEKECEDHEAKDPVHYSCHIAQYRPDRSSGFDSTGNMFSTKLYTHPEAGAHKKQGKKTHAVLDLSKSLNLSGTKLEDITPIISQKRGTFNAKNVGDLNMSNSELTGVFFQFGNVNNINFENSKLLPETKYHLGPNPKSVTFTQFVEDDGNKNRIVTPMVVRGSAKFKNVHAPHLVMAETQFIYNGKKVDFQKAKLMKANLSGLNQGVKNSYINSRKQHPGKFNFEKADLTQANLSGSYFYNGANFKKATLFRANLGPHQKHGPTFLEEANFEEADLRFAILKKAFLKGANLKGADLRYADVTETDFTGADLREADIRGIQGLNTAILEEADFTGAKCWPEQYLILKKRGAGECKIQGGCRYIGRPTIIDIKEDHYEQCGEGYCYNVVRCIDEGLAEVSFRAFCPTQNGKCPSPVECAEMDQPTKYVEYVGKERKKAGGDEVPAEDSSRHAGEANATR